MEAGSQSKINLNWTWINKNKELAKEFSNKNNDNSEYPKELLDQIARIGDLRVHLRLCDAYLEYSIVFPKKSPRNNLICNLDYNQTTLEFKHKMEKVFSVFKKKMDLIKKNYNFCQPDLQENSGFLT